MKIGKTLQSLQSFLLTFFLLFALNACGSRQTSDTNTSTDSNPASLASKSANVIPAIGAYGNGSWLLDYPATGSWVGCGAPANTSKDACFSGFGWLSSDVPVVGDWNGDGRTKIGIYRNGYWYLDYPGTGTWVGCGAPADPTKDACFAWGWSGATPVVGDWNGDGRSKIGAYGNGSWLLDYPGTGSWIGCGAPSDPTKDECFSGFGWISSDVPVVGDWNGSGKSKIGIYRSGAWYLDYPGTGSWIGCGAPSDPTKDECFSGFGWISSDVPVVGDWNGSGKSKIGIYRSGAWYLDYPGTGSWIGCGGPSDPTKDECLNWGWTGATPVVGKWNGGLTTTTTTTTVTSTITTTVATTSSVSTTVFSTTSIVTTIFTTTVVTTTSSSSTTTIGSGTDNVVSLTVNGSQCDSTINSGYANDPCVSVTVCTPGTSTCQTVNGILLDTGSYGLRIFKQKLNNVSLTQVASGPGSLAECVQFADGSSLWGPVQTAGVILGNESAVQVPIQVVDATFGSIPPGCGTPDSNPVNAGFNGILGVGPFPYDCGQSCVSSAVGMYYSCRGTSCSGTAVPLSNQVPNPVVFLPSDNNGLIVQLPSVPATTGSPSVSGSIVLGIGTRSNNSPSGVTSYALDSNGYFPTTYNNTSYSVSFIDTGSNGLFFPSLGRIPLCGGWFCPTSIMSLSATIRSASGSPSNNVSFQIGNFNTLTNSPNNVFNDIGADNTGSFDWGLPFFLGRNVFIGIQGTSSSLGTGPYFAY